MEGRAGAALASLAVAQINSIGFTRGNHSKRAAVALPDPFRCLLPTWYGRILTYPVGCCRAAFWQKACLSSDQERPLVETKPLRSMLTLEHHVTTRLLVGRQSVPLPGPEPVAPRLARPETIIVHEPWWTATARHADIVLPATTSLERNDIGGEPCDRFVIAMHQSIEPVGEARNDFEIFRDLSRRLGCEEAFAEGREETAWLRQIYGTFRERAQSNLVPEFETFWETGWLEIPPRADEYVLFDEFRANPDNHKLRTPSERIERLNSIPTRSPGSAMTTARRIRRDRAGRMARRRAGGAIPVAPRIESAARQIAQPDGCRAGQRARQDRWARNSRDQPRRCPRPRHRGWRGGAPLQRTRRVFRRGGH